ncbi:PAS domain-containing protein [Parasediminibacterium sp. JCM 36343]|uniref:PAS domain-containing protein n=1 Tax=Parasediminibacterium sp. JCM 36343 TaxID=3374279 RepID=UPI00397C9BF2
MMFSQKTLDLLVIEDNLGDALLIQEYLNDVASVPKIAIAGTFAKAKGFLAGVHSFDAVFLDLSLPDHSGEDLVNEIVELAGLTPVIVLTGYSNREFGIKTLALGVSDYLLKDELDVSQLSKSLTYSIERKRIEQKLIKSNERYEIVAKATSDTIWDWDIANKTVVCNHGINTVFGYPEEEVAQTEKWWRARIHPDDYKNIVKALVSIFKSGNSLLQLEYRFRCADDSYKYVLDRAFLVLDDAKKPIRMIGAMQDITSKKEEEHRLKLLESVIAQATDAVLITEAEPMDEPGPRIVYINEAFTKMTGYTREEAIGKTPRMLQGSKSDEEELKKLKVAMENWQPCTIELINYKKNGDEFWINIAISPVADSTGYFTHWIAVERDVTDRRNYLQAIESQNKKLKEIAWTQSHIVRAPVARIMGLVNMLTEPFPGEVVDNTELINIIADSANELDLIIREIVQKTENV